MLKKKLARFKPGVPKRFHLLLAALLWTFIGCLLLFRGVGRLDIPMHWWLVGAAITVGSIKSVLILDRTAKKGIARILNFADGTCIGAVYSLKTWGLVLFMISAGYVLRHSSLPMSLLGFVYVTVGWALLLSSRHAWSTWYKLHK